MPLESRDRSRVTSTSTSENLDWRPTARKGGDKEGAWSTTRRRLGRWAAGTAADTRRRILEAASALFYAQGIRATSADRVIEQVGITKVTFYRHFRTKSDLVVAYLEAQAARDRAVVDESLRDAEPLDALSALAGAIGAVSCVPGFRGCPFINAAAETPDLQDPVRVVVDRHRRWTRDVFARLAAAVGVTDADATAAQLMMLRDGAMVAEYLGDPDEMTATLRSACLAAVATGRPTPA